MLESICGYLWPLNAGLPWAGALGQWYGCSSHQFCLPFGFTASFLYGFASAGKLLWLYFCHLVYLNMCSYGKKNPTCFIYQVKSDCWNLVKFCLKTCSAFPMFIYLRSHSKFHCKVILMLDRPLNVILFVEKWIHLTRNL